MRARDRQAGFEIYCSQPNKAVATNHRVFIAFIATLLAGCAHSRDDNATSRRIITVAVSVIPFERQFRMVEGDAYEFQLPDGKTVAVWCERPRPPLSLMLAEQTTASGLKTVWGERAFKQPELVHEQIGTNSYGVAGWQSYISQGAVTTVADTTTERALYVGNWRFSIAENLAQTGRLPVTITITAWPKDAPRDL